MYNFRVPFFRPPIFYGNNNFQNQYYHNSINFNQTKNYQIPNISNYKQNNNVHTVNNNSNKNILPPPIAENLDGGSTTQSDDVLFEIFGLKIYFDDILLICILLFLYQEGIQDEYLFISLILLLLS